MAAASVTLHLHADDAPVVAPLSNGVFALWLNGPANGPTICGPAERLLKLRDAIDAALQAAVADAEAA